MEEAGFEELGIYIQKRQNTFAQYIAMRPILDLCERSVWSPVPCIFRRWREHEGINLGGVRKWAAVATDREE